MSAAINNQQKRLLSLDALRGFDMFWIIGGEKLFVALFVLTGWTGWKVAGTQVQHSQWHGFTFYDLIFPLFIFLSGVALGLTQKSMADLSLNQRRPIYFKAVKRLLLLCGLGVIYNHGWGAGIPINVDEVRFASVLSRIAFAWFFAAMLVWHTSFRTQVITLVAILVGYWAWLCFIPVPNGVAGDLSNGGVGSWNAWFDTNFLPGTTYQSKAFDPEGILSTIPAIANALFGVIAGRLLKQSVQFGQWKTTGLLIVVGVISLAIGWLWNLIFPVNKQLWTSSFVMVTVGWSFILLAIFYAVVDLLNTKKMAYIFIIIGANSIIIYLATSIVDWNYLFFSVLGGSINAAPPTWQPILQVVALLLTQLLLLHWLYKRKILISI